MRARVTACLLLALAGCAAVSRRDVSGAAPPAVAPDLRGTWTGTWAGTPITLVVSDQAEVGREGIYAGPWIVFGRTAPGASGVLTSTVRGRTVSAAARGVVRPSAAGTTTLDVYASTTFGDQHLALKTDGPDRLVGTGAGAFGPKGDVVLTRTR